MFLSILQYVIKAPRIKCIFNDNVYVLLMSRSNLHLYKAGIPLIPIPVLLKLFALGNLSIIMCLLLNNPSVALINAFPLTFNIHTNKRPKETV